MKTLEQKILKFISSEKLIDNGDKVLIALSGGPDSVFLLMVLNKFRQKLGIELGAAHVHHMLRGEDADGDEVFCGELCGELHIPFYSYRVDVKSYAKENKYSIEEAARMLRYSKLSETAEREGYNKIALAHNINDNAETVLLNLIKGSGISGLSGIPVRRGIFIRPVLTAYKTEILEYLDECGQDYRIDKTNEDENFERNFIRKTLLPAIKDKLNPSVENAIFNSSQTLRSAKSVLENYIKNFETECVEFASNLIKINIKKITDGNLSALGEVFKYSVRKYFRKDIVYNDYLKIRDLLEKQKGRRADLSSNLFAVREEDYISIGEKQENKSDTYTSISLGEEKQTGAGLLSVRSFSKEDAPIDKNPMKEYISGEKLTSPDFIIRTWKEGDKFIPLGMKGFKKLSDFLTDTKLDTLDKEKQLVLVNQNDIVWVIGLRIDDRYKITEKTNTVIELCLK